MNELIKTINLSKSYKELKAVDSLNLSINEGEIYGFLGLNGAGKTTSIRMLLGMVRASSGQAYIGGQRIDKGNLDIWKDVGYIVETPYSYPDLSVRENLELVARLRKIPVKDSVNWIIEKLKLSEYANRKAKYLSLGNAQRLGIAKALIHRPKILILDEPTNGLDPAGIVEVRELLKDLANNLRVTILISSHKLDEISKIATNIGIIHEGRLITTIDSNELDSKLIKALIVDGHHKEAMKSTLARHGYKLDYKGKKLETYKDCIHIYDKDAIAYPENIARILVEEGCPPYLLKLEKEDLEMYFLRTIRESEVEINE